MKKIFYTLLIISLALIFSCDEVKNPLKPASNQCGDDTQPVPIRKILVEDFTGHTCPNCPPAAEQMAFLKQKYCDYIVPVALHVSVFATPNSTYPEDFRTAEGTEIDQYFGVSAAGLPHGLVNRMPYNENPIIVYAEWAAAIEALLLSPPEMYLTINTSFNPVDSLVSISVRTDILKNVPDNLSLSVYLTQDSIIAPQKDIRMNPVLIPNFVHQHVLRAVINGTWGEQITDAPSLFGNMIEKTYSIKIKPEWNVSHCEIVAFVFRSDSRDVIQAESKPIVSD